MTAIARLSDFVVKTTLEDCPRPALDAIRRAALDTVGVMLAGAGEPAARAVREVIRAEGGAPLCTVLGTALRTAPTWAALANGTAGHAHDFDDTSFALMGHPSVPLLAALLACAEAEMADGAALALGYLVGFEVNAALGSGLNPPHYERGWHATSTIGTFGCAAGAARVLGLDPAQTRQALALAASLASGVQENFGTMTKPYHAGHAARSGVLAARLAREGLTASESALDGKRGFSAAFGGNPLDEAVERLGRRWHLVDSGIAVKPYPSCAFTHPAVDALLDLRRQHGLEAGDVTAVEIGISRIAIEVLSYPRPATALERKFSMQFCAATALVEGRLDFLAFRDGEVDDPVVQALMPAVTMVADESLAGGAEQARSRVTVRLRDGRALHSPPRGASGHPDRPLSAQALHEKFLGCASPVVGRDEAEAVAEQIAHLEDIPDVRALTARLVGGID
ncbi:MAG TPA: MmgE/PrpD family protein [Methylomirabilota bacterium]|nr:MmgE/PrpD family protein [Methylomirabilota bacterium]